MEISLNCVMFQVIVKGGRKKDLIGVRLRVQRGRLDCAEVQKKMQR